MIFMDFIHFPFKIRILFQEFLPSSGAFSHHQDLHGPEQDPRRRRRAGPAAGLAAARLAAAEHRAAAEPTALHGNAGGEARDV